MKYEANKSVTLAGVKYQPGDPVDVTQLSSFKVGQLLNQHILRPAL